MQGFRKVLRLSIEFSSNLVDNFLEVELAKFDHFLSVHRVQHDIVNQT